MRVRDCMDGAFDLHVHSAPDIDVRRYDDIELARHAASGGLRGILIKSHQGSTVERAYLVQRVVPDVLVLGGLVLNYPVGGFNVAAVEVALALGARQVWMPTRDAANHRHAHRKPGGLHVLDAEGQLKPEVLAVIGVIAGTNCILSTGHLSPMEGTAVLRHAHALGHRKLLVTHPEWSHTYYSDEMQVALRDEVGAHFERCYVSTTHRCGFTPFERIEAAIAAVGVQHSILSSDLGQPDTPPPVEGLNLYAERLLASGFTADQVRAMFVETPSTLLGL
jgi:hypothetical protein